MDPNHLVQCQKLHCTLKASTCVARQNARYVGSKAPIYVMCNTRQHCDQGEAISRALPRDFTLPVFHEQRSPSDRAAQRIAKRSYIKQLELVPTIQINLPFHVQHNPFEKKLMTQTAAIEAVNHPTPLASTESKTAPRKHCSVAGCKRMLRRDSRGTVCFYHLRNSVRTEAVATRVTPLDEKSEFLKLLYGSKIPVEQFSQVGDFIDIFEAMRAKARGVEVPEKLPDPTKWASLFAHRAAPKKAQGFAQRKAS